MPLRGAQRRGNLNLFYGIALLASVARSDDFVFSKSDQKYYLCSFE
jgi:hypothetical protein